MTEPLLSWVCCPNGVVDGRLRLSVVVVPRLGTGGTLADYPALVDWPHQLAGVRLTVAFGPGSVEEEATLVGDPADSGLWRAVFPATTPVRAFGTARDRTSGDSVLSYPARDVAGALRASYASAAKGTEDLSEEPAAAFRPTFDLRPLQEFQDNVGTAVQDAIHLIEQQADVGVVEVAVHDPPATHRWARPSRCNSPCTTRSRPRARTWICTASSRCSVTIRC